MPSVPARRERAVVEDALLRELQTWSRSSGLGITTTIEDQLPALKSVADREHQTMEEHLAALQSVADRELQTVEDQLAALKSVAELGEGSDDLVREVPFRSV